MWEPVRPCVVTTGAFLHACPYVVTTRVSVFTCVYMLITTRASLHACLHVHLTEGAAVPGQPEPCCRSAVEHSKTPGALQLC